MKIPPDSHPSQSPSPAAAALGYAGLIPFVGLALAAMFAPTGYRALANQALLGYGACILSFLGAIHWGLVMRGTGFSSANAWLWGVGPSLVAWLALLLPLPMGLWLIAIALLACFGVDKLVYPRFDLQAWLPMRLRLTLTACTCCIAGAWGYAA